MKIIRAFNTNRKIWIEDWAYAKVRWINWSDDGKQLTATINGKTVRIARWIKDIKDPNIVVDHWDGNYRNNLDSNLRVCTKAENNRNRKPWRHKANGSKFLGTLWHECDKKWYAKIYVNGTQIFLGSFDTEEEAAKAYDIAAIFYHKEFARLNCPCPFLATDTFKD